MAFEALFVPVDISFDFWVAEFERVTDREIDADGGYDFYCLGVRHFYDLVKVAPTAFIDREEPTAFGDPPPAIEIVFDPASAGAETVPSVQME